MSLRICRGAKNAVRTGIPQEKEMNSMKNK
jgi:hypothetical protein